MILTLLITQPVLIIGLAGCLYWNSKELNKLKKETKELEQSYEKEISTLTDRIRVATKYADFLKYLLHNSKRNYTIVCDQAQDLCARNTELENERDVIKKEYEELNRTYSMVPAKYRKAIESKITKGKN